MSVHAPRQKPASIPPRPGDLRLALLIARRAALESLRDRMTLLMSVFFALLLPVFMVFTVIRPLAAPSTDPKQTAALGIVMAVYLLLVGTLPSSAAVGIAAGQFAGEKEQGSLAPLLASPASNGAIFAGKVLGAIIPAILFSVVAEIGYLAEIAIIIGPNTLRLLPLALSLAMLALVPGFALLGATVASLISSRVRTFNAAQQIGGLVLLPIMFGLFGLAFKLPDWGTLTLVFAVVGILLADIMLLAVSAVTWRREEVLARR
jgi:ABC-type Na+ efflux pump permease subunit